MSSSPVWLSVIIPAHNAAATIDCTLDSLAAQSMHEWEAIVVDDRSTDLTAARVATRMQGDARIRMLAVQAFGAAAARNAGIAQARGRYLLFLDADDWISPRYMATMRDALARAPAGAVAFCAYCWVNLDGEQLPALYEPRIVEAPAEIFTRQCGTAIHCVVLERALVERLGGFDVTLCTCEDWDLWYRVARSGAPFVGVPDVLAFYRMSPGSLTSRTEQLIRDGTALLARSFGADPRLPPEQHGPGSDTLGLGGHALWLTFLYVWFAAVDVGRGKRAGHVFETVRPPPGLLHHLNELSETVVGAMLVGACCRPEQLIDRAPLFRAPLEELYAALESATGEPGLSRALAYDCERRILHLGGLKVPQALSRVMGARFDPARPQVITPPAGVDLLYLQVYDGDRSIGNLDVPLFGVFDAAAARDRLMLEAGGPRWFLRCAPPTQRARFAGYFASHALRRSMRFARRLPRRGVRGLRSELATAARVAAERVAGKLSAPRTWNQPVSGAKSRRVQTEELPVLMYHRVAASGPASLARYRVTPEAFYAQMQLLRRRGYHALSASLLRDHFARDRPFSGRPVLITFDDGYADFAATAWPILREFGLTAEVFVVSDLVGQAAHWDTDSGPPAALMSWAEIRALAAQGVHFGSHLATHRRVDTLSTTELAAELARSRATLERELGREVRSIAAPFGFIDSRFLWLAPAAGYQIGFSTQHGHARLGATPLALSRLEVRGDMQLEAFTQLLST